MSCRSSSFIWSCKAVVSGSHDEISQALEGHWHPAWNETSLHSRNPVWHNEINTKQGQISETATMTKKSHIQDLNTALTIIVQLATTYITPT